MCFDCVFGCAVELFDSQVLFDPFEEKFDLPAAAVKLCDGQRRQVEVVGQEHQILVVFGIIKLDAAQVLWVSKTGFDRSQCDGLIAAQSGGFVHGTRVDTAAQQIGFATNDEERLCLVQLVPTSKIGEAAIHDVKAAGFGYEDVEYVDLVHLAVADVNDGRDIAAQSMGLFGGYFLWKSKWRRTISYQLLQ